MTPTAHAGFFISNYEVLRLKSWSQFLMGMVKLNSLNSQEQEQLAESAISTTQLAYKQKGVTVEKNLYDLLREQGMSRRQARHYVFTRDGMNCHACEGIITHTRLSGRRLDYCDGCQV